MQGKGPLGRAVRGWKGTENNAETWGPGQASSSGGPKQAEQTAHGASPPGYQWTGKSAACRLTAGLEAELRVGKGQPRGVTV